MPGEDDQTKDEVLAEVIVPGELRESMRGTGIKVILERAKEKYAQARATGRR